MRNDGHVQRFVDTWTEELTFELVLGRALWQAERPVCVTLRVVNINPHPHPDYPPAARS